MSLRVVLAIVAGLLSFAGNAAAHPHVWVDVRTQLLFDDAGSLTGFRHDWTFDEGYSAFAVSGLDTDADGALTRAELEPLAKVNMESLGEFDFFTFLTADGRKIELSDPVDYYVDYENGHAVLHFTLPVKAPLDVHKGDISFAVYDPTFFVDFTLGKDAPVTLGAKAPPPCKVETPQPVAAADKVAGLSQFSEADFNNPDVTLPIAGGDSDRIRLICGQ